MTTNGESSGRRVKSVSRAFNIIEYLHDGGSATLSEIAEAFEMPMSTAHIHMSTLVETEYVTKDDGVYRCSLRFLQIGGTRRDRMALFNAAKTEVDDLQKQLGENANVGTIENGYMVQLYKSENPESIDDDAPLGEHLYLHSTATGKAMLSQLSESQLDHIIDVRGLPKLTAATLRTREELLEELDAVREREYAINSGEHFAGVRAVAVPIMLKRGEVGGSISLSGPLSRMGKQRIEDEIAPELFDARNIIELKLKQN